jgi:hypothetical protein
MSKFTFVCFDCRSTSRREMHLASGDGVTGRDGIEYVVRCPRCKKDMIGIGDKGRLPVKSDTKGWQSFQREHALRARTGADWWLKRHLQHIQYMEEKIVALQPSRSADDARQEIRKLEKALTASKRDVAIVKEAMAGNADSLVKAFALFNKLR